MDVRKPLKRKKKLVKRDWTKVIVTCKYKRLGEFCFTCGILTHTERYCTRFSQREDDTMEKESGSWLKAQVCRNPNQ